MPTPLRLAAILSLLLLLPFSAHSRASVRYFAIWSYVENAPAEEIPESSLAGRSLGYWELHFDPEGGVVEGVYRNGGGSPWLVLRYVEDAEKIYADLYLPDGSFIVRKSTRLTSRAPSWPEPGS
jgi:hypothetical protein